jgi:hypothetical protein
VILSILIAHSVRADHHRVRYAVDGLRLLKTSLEPRLWRRPHRQLYTLDRFVKTATASIQVRAPLYSSSRRLIHASLPARGDLHDVLGSMIPGHLISRCLVIILQLALVD